MKLFITICSFLLLCIQSSQFKIESPRNNAHVDRVITVNGNAGGQRNIFIYVYASGLKKWIYQSKARIKNNVFEGKAWIGAVNEHGSKYEIIALSGDFNPGKYGSVSNLKSIPYEERTKYVEVIRK